MTVITACRFTPAKGKAVSTVRMQLSSRLLLGISHLLFHDLACAAFDTILRDEDWEQLAALADFQIQVGSCSFRSSLVRHPGRSGTSHS